MIINDKIIINEKDLESCLVKILYPDTEEINGTGFFCHPNGYILTCYHVINPYAVKGVKEVLFVHENIKLKARICEKYCIEEADIAILKLSKSIISPPYVLLDVHNRWNIDDGIYSHGYPIGEFQEFGISFTGSIVGTTRMSNGVEVVQISDLSILNSDPGYSGAPVFHLDTKKIIGLINAKLIPSKKDDEENQDDKETQEEKIKLIEETQAFFVPLQKLFQNWPEFKDFHDVFKKIREKIAQEAGKKLNEKLRSSPFIPLRLECGKKPEKPSSHKEKDPNKEQKDFLEKDRDQKKECLHGRRWVYFDVNKLLSSSSSYILSSSVGAGKTTFLLWFAKRLAENTKNAPVFITCEDFEDINPSNLDSFISHLISQHDKSFLYKDIKDFFNIYFEQRKLFFIFDGLDQIKGNDYFYIIEKIKKITFPCPFLISSRPSALLALEDKTDIPFLRLRSFSLEEEERYFGDDYEKVKKISAMAPDLTRLPMLAYMIKTLISKKKDIENLTRTDLYVQFLNYIIYEHDTNIRSLSRNVQHAHYIQETLKRLSFEALALKIPQTQKVSEGLFYSLDSNIKIDEITQFGLVNLILEKGHCLFFTHQSFQEFLAAQYVNEHEGLIEKVIDELWAPKWKEVIKFLAGLRGEEIIKQIYQEKDNVICSRLFLCSECLPEVREIKKEIKEEIKNRIRELVKEGPFILNAIKALIYLNDIEHLKLLLRSPSGSIRFLGIQGLSVYSDKVDPTIIKEIIGMLRDKLDIVRREAIQALPAFSDRIDLSAIQKIIDILRDKNDYWGVRRAIVQVLPAFSKRADSSNIQKIIAMLMDKDSYIRWAAIQVLPAFSDRVDSSNIQKIIAMLEDENRDVRSSAIQVLPAFSDRIDLYVIQKIIDMLKDKDDFIQWVVIQTLPAFSNKITPGIIQKIIGMLKEKDEYVRWAAVKALSQLSDRIDTSINHELIEMLRNKNRSVRRAALQVFPVFGDRVPPPLLQEIVRMLWDDDRYVRRTAIQTLQTFNKTVDTSIIRVIIEMLKDEDGSVRVAALQALPVLSERLDKLDIQEIIGRLRDKDSNVRIAAIQALSTFSNKMDPSFIQEIIDMAIDNDSNVRKALAKVLPAFSEIDDTSIIPTVIKMINDDDGEVRKTAVEALSKFSNKVDSSIIQKIVKMLRDDYEDVRSAAVKVLHALSDIVDISIIHDIIQILKDGDGHVREAALKALHTFSERINDEDMNEILSCLRDKDSNVRQGAIQTFTKFNNNRINSSIIQEIVERLKDKDCDVNRSAYQTLKIFYERGIKIL